MLPDPRKNASPRALFAKLRPPALLLVLPIVAPACDPSSTLPLGDWNGSEVAVRVYADSTTIALPCRNGSIPGSISLDSDGRFSRTMLARSGGGAPHTGIGATSLTIEGYVRGDQLTFVVADHPSTVYWATRGGSEPIIPGCPTAAGIWPLGSD